MKQTDFAKILTRYLAEFLPGQRNVSLNTIRSYRDTYKQMLGFFSSILGIKAERITFKDTTADHIKEFLVWLEKERGISINTRNQRLAAIHSFFRYAQGEYPEILHESQRILGIPFKKRNHSTVEYLTKECLKIFLEQPDTSTKKGRRDLAVISILYDTGARVQELIDLKVCNVRLQKPATITLTGKGNKTRCVPLMDKVSQILQYYMEENHLLDNGRQQTYLFYNSRYECFTRPGITYILNKYFKQAKNTYTEIIFPKTIHPHLIRHTKAIHLLESGVNLIYIRDLLGHVSVTTTEIYLRAETELKRVALENTYPEVVTQNIPLWTENTELLQWLDDFCR
ncbi:site-specific integrase [Clostridium sp. PL3]|uniref:Site-specific integrase n=1 Tax=Clostridium thailandense TaxID=2794346 RepID=A0A949TNM0_9CLOT|nr:tyrosine-type recombinase/integrase [Clostridium thailandense]MBV7275715.1 site-specific integrase [Clostridium thailandense]